MIRPRLVLGAPEIRGRSTPNPSRQKEVRHGPLPSDEELSRTAPAEVASFASPVPTQIVSNGEFNPLPQTRDQQRVEARIKELADDCGPRHGMNRRQFLASSAGMAAAFLAMNAVFGPVFDVSPRGRRRPPEWPTSARAPCPSSSSSTPRPTSCATTSISPACSTWPSTPSRTGTRTCGVTTRWRATSSRTTSRRSSSTATPRWRSCRVPRSTIRRGIC